MAGVLVSIFGTPPPTSGDRFQASMGWLKNRLFPATPCKPWDPQARLGSWPSTTLIWRRGGGGVSHLMVTSRPREGPSPSPPW